MTSLSDLLIPFDHQDIADAVLFEFLDLCAELRISCFLALGTALGFYRSGGYIHKDPNIDVFIRCFDVHRQTLVERLALAYFEINTIPVCLCVRNERRQEFSPTMNIHTIKDSILLEIWFHQRRDFSAFYQGNNFFLYKGRRLRLPSNIENYLSLIYGDWNTPSDLPVREERTQIGKRANCFEPV